jgi:ribosomal-protein-serine acetyltransferase
LKGETVKVAGMTLETAVMAHSFELFLLVDSNREHLRKWLPWVDGVSSEEDTSTFLLRTMDQRDRGLGSHYAVFFNGAMAGMAGFHPVDWPNRNAEVGYWLGEKFTGRGLATASVHSLFQEGFQDLELNRIEIRCASGNLPSIAVAKRLGMVYEGTLREEEWLYSRYVDHHVYSILKREFSVGTY